MLQMTVYMMFIFAFLSFCGIVPFGVLFFIKRIRKNNRKAFGITSLACIAGTILFIAIGFILIPKCDHDYRTTDQKAATCVDNGYIEYTCSKCGWQSFETEKAKGHDFEVISRKEPTTKEDGEIVEKCKKCGETKSTVLPKPTEKSTEKTTEPPKPTEKPTEEPKEKQKPTEVPKQEEKTKEKPTEAPQKTAKQIEEEYKNSCKNIKYSDLARNPEKYKGQKLHFKGNIQQVVEPSWFRSNTIYLISVTPVKYDYIDETFWEDNIYATIKLEKGEDRILEGDIVDVWGECEGLASYYSVLGSKESIPEIKIKYYKVN